MKFAVVHKKFSSVINSQKEFGGRASMPEINGYALSEKIHEKSGEQIFRGRRVQDGLPVIIKLAGERGSREARLRQEYEIGRFVQCDGAVQTLDLLKTRDGLALILEDVGGVALADILRSKKISLLAFLRIALRLSETLGKIHSQGVVHKNITPDAILVNTETGEVRLIDFGIASRLSRELNVAAPISSIEGALVYMSPEQTGRMNRPVDYRSDFYSLGVCFYEMLAGRPPFSSRDPMELVHCHIAVAPPPLRSVSVDAPEVVAAIVERLLSKNAEERYQSAFGLKSDLARCLESLKNTGRIESFPIGESDISERFQIPARLYGREREVAALAEIFDRIAEGAVGFFQVSGDAGSGKSSLVHELLRPIVSKRGFFAAGKFDQLQRDIPYSALFQAMRDLLRQVLTESAERLEAWRQALVEATGENIGLLIRFFPELTAVIGPAPDVPDLPPLEAQNRFTETFQKFLRTFSSAERPLVLFLDDLQWADTATLKLMQTILLDPDAGRVLLVAAWREKEAGAEHPLHHVLKRIEQSSVIRGYARPAPLSPESVVQLVSDALRASPEDCRPLAELALAKTHGNPFFISELLKRFYHERLINFDPDRGRWVWDLEGMRSFPISENVADFLTETIDRLPATTALLLRQAACIGAEFGIGELGAAAGQDQETLALNLEPAFQEGLIEPLGDGYRDLRYAAKGGVSLDSIRCRFAHDRIQQAAYSQLSEDLRARTHLAAGRRLLDRLESDSEKPLFDAVNHLNLVADRIRSPADRLRLAQLNLKASEKARESSAYEQALKYAEQGWLFCDADAWRTHYDLARDLHLQLLQLQYLTLQPARAEETGAALKLHAQSNLDRATALEQAVWYATSQGNYAEAITIGRSALRLLGLKLPQKPGMASIVFELVRFNLTLGRRKPEGLIDQQRSANAAAIVATRLLSTLSAACYIAEPNLLPIAVFRSATIFLREGYTAYHPFAIQTLALILGPGLGQFDRGLAFANLSLKLLEKFGDRAIAGRTRYAYETFARHWMSPQRETLEGLMESARQAGDSGDFEFRAWSRFNWQIQAFLSGANLGEIKKQCDTLLSALVASGQMQVARINAVVRRLCYGLLGDADEEIEKFGMEFDAENLLSHFHKAGARSGVAHAHITSGILDYYSGRFSDAGRRFRLAKPYLDSIVGTMLSQDYLFYSGLNTCQAALTLRGFARYRAERSVQKAVKILSHWAARAPANFECRLLLLQAELFRLRGESDLAAGHFDRAIATAKAGDFPHIEGLASERAAEFYEANGRKRIARTYIDDARRNYRRWGAGGLLKNFRERHAALLNYERAGVLAASDPSEPGADGVTPIELDLGSVLKSAQALSSEIFLDRLLQALMRIVIENAGAQKGWLLLRKDSVLQLAAIATAEDVITDRNRLQFDESDESAFPVSVLKFVERSGEPIVLGRAAFEGEFTGSPYIAKHQPESVLCIPLKNKGRITGLLYLENNLARNAFTEGRVEVLKILASQAAISLENAALVAEETERQKLAKEMEMARQVQLSILPQFPEDPAYRISGHMTPAAQVGGDYYDYHRIGDWRYLAIGDVTGHGLNSGLLMLMAQTCFNTCLVSSAAPAVDELLTAMNRVLHANMNERTQQQLYMTCTALRANSEGAIEHAGKHEDLLVWRKRTRKVERYASDGFWLGLAPDVGPMTTVSRLQLDPGDILTLYTDGVIECRDHQGRQFDIPRLIESIEANAGLGADGLKDGIVRDCFQYMHLQEDDLTLVVIERMAS